MCVFSHLQVVLDRLDAPEGDSQIVNAKFVVGADGIFDYQSTEQAVYLIVLQAHTLGFANLWESKWRANRPVSFPFFSRRLIPAMWSIRCADYIWGVIDTIPDTDLPDIRCKSVVHSENGSCITVPRENDIVRLYIQLSDKEVIDQKTGRVNREKINPEKIFEVQTFFFLLSVTLSVSGAELSKLNFVIHLFEKYETYPLSLYLLC
jgi:hypothetical protein